MKHLRHILSLGILIALVSSASAQSWLTNGLAAYYPFSGNANDESGNGNNGVAYGTTYGVDRFGTPNSTASFNGSSYIDTTYGAKTFGKITLSAWAITPNPLYQSPIIMQRGGATCNSIVWTYLASGVGFHFGTSPFSYIKAYSTPPATSQWHHFVGVYDGHYTSFYVDGVMLASSSTLLADGDGVITSDSSNLTVQVATTFYLGWDNVFGSGVSDRYFNGNIDDVRIYNRALSSNEVAQLYAIESSNICTPHKATATPVLVNGFVVGATITDSGCGYTNAPLVLIQGGGGAGATATATVNNGQVTGININSAGSGYSTNPAPRIVIASPPFEPTVGIRFSRVEVTQHVTLGRNYVLESSADLATWSATGQAFTAVSENYTNEFVVGQTGQFFRLREVP